ncbi:hypothetical protein T440DRAFT_200833 [Plenodomus tracheiphilus IPT5]|uniref:Uncharacterized protein n=1 Tax=Plenodomus tracheiphilus IPT5 TaxID=1408161 RepID=A0A6A7BHY3_9PLEO|nr:hypothetical protein T440DRAFT_200833 [Plenodomus tracheiphilus IPT5]
MLVSESWFIQLLSLEPWDATLAYRRTRRTTISLYNEPCHDTIMLGTHVHVDVHAFFVGIGSDDGRFPLTSIDSASVASEISHCCIYISTPPFFLRKMVTAFCSAWHGLAGVVLSWLLRLSSLVKNIGAPCNFSVHFSGPLFLIYRSLLRQINT